MKLWTPLHDEYLALAIEGEGRGGRAATCARQAVEPHSEGVYWCKDCLHRELVCRECCVGMHKPNPLHRVEVCQAYTQNKGLISV